MELNARRYSLSSLSIVRIYQKRIFCLFKWLLICVLATVCVFVLVSNNTRRNKSNKGLNKGSNNGSSNGLNKGSNNRSSNGSNTLPCDSECIKFRLLLSNWPLDRPKSIIYYLTQSQRLEVLKVSFLSLEKYFNERYQYPIVIFHESDLSSELHGSQIRSWVSGPVFFQSISFSVPSFVNISLARFDMPCVMSIGYRHMCRFHAKEIYKQPILTGVDYAWRLDDDSVILGNISYDLFTFMKLNDFIYGYRVITQDSMVCIRELWPATEHYLKARTHCNSELFLYNGLHVFNPILS